MVFIKVSCFFVIVFLIFLVFLFIRLFSRVLWSVLIWNLFLDDFKDWRIEFSEDERFLEFDKRLWFGLFFVLCILILILGFVIWWL